MTLGDVWTELESDMEWRQSEMRLLSNSLRQLNQQADKDRFRRVMVVMLYAHVEGFCKVALSTYVQVINRAAPPCRDVTECIAAASFHDVFHALVYGDKKGRVFQAPPPADEKLLMFARHRDFLVEFASLSARPICVPENVVNTEDNLGSEVLRRNLFRLGFPVDLLEAYEVALEELRNRRNGIAHGSDDSTVRDKSFEPLRKAVFDTMDDLTLAIVVAVERRHFLRSSNAT